MNAARQSRERGSLVGFGNNYTGDVCAVECKDCEIDAGSIHLAALGIKGLVVKFEDGVLTVAKKSWLKRHAVKTARK